MGRSRVGEGDGWLAQVTLQTNRTSFCAKGADTWTSNHTTKQSRLSSNSHGYLEAASYQCQLIKANQELSQSF